MRHRFILLVTIGLLATHLLPAQTRILKDDGTRSPTAPTSTTGNNGRPLGPNSRTTGGDSLTHRTFLEDSLTISYKYWDSTRTLLLDSNVLHLDNRFAVPYHHVYLGNLGSASHSLLFSPRMSAGFDAGFHAYDAYQYKLQDTRFFTTTRPYAELGYILAGRAEQTVSVLFTENINTNANASLEYRFISSPGGFKNLQNSGHSIRLSASFVGKARRYSGFVVFINNKVSAGENGGILSNSLLKDNRYSDRFLLPTVLGGDGLFATNFFANANVTGAAYKNSTLYFRHQYDFGQKDSVLTDSTVVRLFYPRFRLQHTLTIGSSTYAFADAISPDSIKKYYGYTSLASPLRFQDKWAEIKNEFALIAFPEKKNQNQFLKLGAAYQQLNATIDNATLAPYNIYLLGEYRNRTRNKKYEINANGQFFVNGFNAGDYAASITVQTFLGKKIGYAQLGFDNTNHSPGFVYDARSSYPLLPTNINLGKENISHLQATFTQQRLGLQLSGHYYLIAHYTYFNGFFTAAQSSALVNVLRLTANKQFELSRRIHLYSEIHFQQSTGNVINLPTLFTRQRIAFEGNFFKNLFLSTGLDIKYYSPYKADNYSPLTGQFFLQEKITISNRPDVAAFFHFRIKSFNAFLRLENLNTLSLSPSFGFTNNNFAAPLYPTQGMVFRLGVKWGFVN